MAKMTSKRISDRIRCIECLVEDTAASIVKSKSIFGKLDLTVHLKKLELELAEARLDHYEAVQAESVACTYSSDY